MINFFYNNNLASTLEFLKSSKFSVRVDKIEDANIIIHNELLQNLGKNGDIILKKLSQQYPTNIKIVVFIVDDFEKRYTYFPNLILLRTSLQKSLMKPNEIVLAYIWDHQTTNFNFQINTILPQIGFCGFVSKHRRKIVRVFENSKAVQCNFIKQKDFWGGNPHQSDVIKLFYNNLETNQYILCNRGGGNFSMRFYETLAAGRVPVLVDTDIELPFCNIINWEEIIILQKTEKLCLQAVLNDFNIQGYIERQLKASTIFKEYFSKENYFDMLLKNYEVFNVI